jgi:threonine synthase
MKYLSTRGGSFQTEKGPQPLVGFLDVLLGGLAPDGGLVMPETYPKIDAATLKSWRSLSYADLAAEIFSLYSDDIPKATLQSLARKTYTQEVFGSADITPVSQLAPGLFLQHLSQGPTLAFKDVAMQMLGNLFEYALAQRGETLNILGATSGDTGSAAEYAMRGKSGIKVFMLTPYGRMSPFQVAQMYSLLDPEIFNIAVNGVFDDCQDLVKAVSNDAAFKAKYKIGTVNSINWGRVLAQVVYYFKGYLSASTDETSPVSFTVPSGNFGNVFAGHVARQMGLPIAKLVVATNENNVLQEFFSTGTYRPRQARETYATSSPSMDISKASNFERFIYDLVGRDGARVAALWKQLETQGYFDLSALQPQFVEYGFVSGASDHNLRLQTIRKTYRLYNRVVDTHTADGLAIAEQFIEPNVPMICLETALPAKFAQSIQEALGQEAPRPPQFAGLESLTQKYTFLPTRVDLLKQYIAQRA